MDKRDKEKLTSQLEKLISKTQWNETLQRSLVTNKVFGQKLLDLIVEEEGQARKRKLYLDVQKRGPHAFQNLVKSLIESENYEAAVLLDNSATPKPNSHTYHCQLSREQKVWNEPSYSEELPPISFQSENANETPEVDDRSPLEVKVKRATSWKGPPQFKAYPMKSNPRGLCLIIDNEEFENDVMSKREGSIFDSNNLDFLFSELGFQVTLRRNLNYNEMIKMITDFSSHRGHEKSDMCVIAILSHGHDGLIFSKDNRQIPTEWVLRQFNNEGCPMLKGKPKFFILQACRGDDHDYGYVPRIDTTESSPTGVDAQGVSLPRRRLSSQVFIKDPTWEDMLIAYATIPGYVANRNIFRGTWFVEAICQVFMEHACEMDIREMLDEVSSNMRYRESESFTKQSCSYEVRHFYKKLFFNPGICFYDETPKFETKVHSNT